MPKNLFLIGLATITLAATTLTNVANSRADSVITPTNNTFCGVPSGCDPAPAPSTPSNPPPVTDRFHSLPYPSYPAPVGNIYIPQYPYYPTPISNIPIPPFPYPNSPKSEPPATQTGDCITDCTYVTGSSAK